MKKKPFFSKMEKRIMAIVGMAWLIPFSYSLYWTTGSRKPTNEMIAWNDGGKYQAQIDKYFANMHCLSTLTWIAYIVVILFLIYIWYYKALLGYKRYPIVEGEAKVIGKRTAVEGYVMDGSGGVGTNCFVTFEYPDQQRIELLVANNLYGTLMIGDTGKLKSQGNCMLDFQRHLKKWDLRDKPDKKAQDEEKSGEKNSDIKTTAT